MDADKTRLKQDEEASARARKRWAVVRDAFLQSASSLAIEMFLDVGQVLDTPQYIACVDTKPIIACVMMQKRIAARSAVASGHVKTNSTEIALRHQGDLSLYTIVRRSFLC
jgi:hypothetical protein